MSLWLNMLTLILLSMTSLFPLKSNYASKNTLIRKYWHLVGKTHCNISFLMIHILTTGRAIDVNTHVAYLDDYQPVPQHVFSIQIDSVSALFSGRIAKERLRYLSRNNTYSPIIWRFLVNDFRISACRRSTWTSLSVNAHDVFSEGLLELLNDFTCVSVT